MSAVEIPLTQGLVALVDEADAERVRRAGPWHAKVHRHVAYAAHSTRASDGHWTTQSLHQFLTGYKIVDHRNGDGLDNRRHNLREATRFQNRQNSRRQSHGNSGFKGVSFQKHRGKWRARITVDGGARRSLGHYTTPEEAARAYDVAARELHGEYAALNFPVDGERAA